MLEQSLGKWETTGLLQGLSSENAAKCAEILEKVSCGILGQQDLPSMMILIPSIRRMVGNGFFPDALWVIKDFRAWWEKTKSSMDFSFTEQEVELCIKYAEECPIRYSQQQKQV